MTSSRPRTNKGSLLGDAPIAMWLLLMFLVLPLVDMATICLRATFLYFAVRNAVRTGSRAGSYQNAVNGLSAVQIVNNNVNMIAKAWSGVQINTVSTGIVITSLSDNTVTRQSTKLSTPADDANFTYQLEASVNGSISPLLLFNSAWFGPVPGLTAPLSLTMTDRQYFENPQVLNL